MSCYGPYAALIPHSAAIVELRIQLYQWVTNTAANSTTHDASPDSALQISHPDVHVAATVCFDPRLDAARPYNSSKYPVRVHLVVGADVWIQPRCLIQKPIVGMCIAPSSKERWEQEATPESSGTGLSATSRGGTIRRNCGGLRVR